MTALNVMYGAVVAIAVGFALVESVGRSADRRTLATVWLLVAALVIVGLASTASAAQSRATTTDFLRIADRTWGPSAPCAGRLSVTLGVSSRVQPDEVGWATGTTLGDCSMQFDPAFWENASDEVRCLLVVHEAGHLAGREHTPEGVMSEDAAVGEGDFPPCRAVLSVRQRAIHRIRGHAPASSPSEVFCGAWDEHGRLLCRLEWPVGSIARIQYWKAVQYPDRGYEVHRVFGRQASGRAADDHGVKGSQSKGRRMIGKRPNEDDESVLRDAAELVEGQRVEDAALAEWLARAEELEPHLERLRSITQPQPGGAVAERMRAFYERHADITEHNARREVQAKPSTR